MVGAYIISKKGGGLASFISVVKELLLDIYSLTPGAREKEFYREVFFNCRLRVGSSNDPMLPIVLKRQTRKYGYDLVIHVPPGLSAMSFIKRKAELEHAFDAEIEIEAIGNQNILLRVFPFPIPEKIDYAKPELPKEMALPVLIGYSRAGMIIEDLAQFPHLCVAGETFGGKSTFLRQALVTLKLERPETGIYIIDMKRLEFSFFAKHSWYAYTMPEAIRLLEYLHKEMYDRLALLDKAMCVNIQEYHQRGGMLPYCVLALDEFSQLCPELAKNDKDKDDRKYAHSMLVDLVCLARAVGIHVIICTQRPDYKVLPGQLKANIPAALCFRVKNGVNSDIVLDNTRAAYLPRIRGRAIWQFDREIEVQVPWLTTAQAREMLQRVPERAVAQEEQKAEILPF